MRIHSAYRVAALFALMMPTVDAFAQGYWYTAAEYGTDAAARAAWTATVSGVQTDIFSDLPTYNGITGPLTRLSGDMTITTPVEFYPYDIGSVYYLGTTNPGDPMTFAFNTPTRAFGGWFNASDFSGNQTTDNMRFLMSDGSSRDIAGQVGQDSFIGYISSGNLGSMTLSAPSLTSWSTTREFSIASGATVGAVPEPGEWAAMGVLGAGLAALVLRRRRA